MEGTENTLSRFFHLKALWLAMEILFFHPVTSCDFHELGKLEELAFIK